MEPELRFDRALGIPDGIVAPDHRLTAAAIRMMNDLAIDIPVDDGEAPPSGPSDDDDEEEEVIFLKECVRYLRERYVDGQLDLMMLRLDRDREPALCAAVQSTAKEWLSERNLGEVLRVDRQVIDKIVAFVIDQLRNYISRHPVDVD